MRVTKKISGWPLGAEFGRFFGSQHSQKQPDVSARSFDVSGAKRILKLYVVI